MVETSAFAVSKLSLAVLSLSSLHTTSPSCFVRRIASHASTLTLQTRYCRGAQKAKVARLPASRSPVVCEIKPYNSYTCFSAAVCPTAMPGLPAYRHCAIKSWARLTTADIAHLCVSSRSVRSSARGSRQHVMEISTNMEVLVRGRGFGEGYHVLFVGGIATFV